MSAGAFVLSKYADNAGIIHAIRVQPETLAAQVVTTANAAPTAGVTAGALRTRAKGSRRRYGQRARGVVMRFTAAPPTGYLANQNYSIPILVKATWDLATDAGVGTYLGVATVIVSKYDEANK
jgi:hypothetical protein